MQRVIGSDRVGAGPGMQRDEVAPGYSWLRVATSVRLAEGGHLSEGLEVVLPLHGLVEVGPCCCQGNL